MSYIETLEPRRLFAIAGADPSFGTAGTARIDFSAYADHDNHVNSLESTLTQDAQGRTYVIAPLFDYSDRVCVARLDRAGKLDPTYGKKGIASFPIQLDINGFGYPISAADSGGRLYVLANGQLQRFTSTGQLDPTFGKGGQVEVEQLDVKLMTIDSHGLPLLAGTIATSGPTQTEVIRIGETGAVAPSFLYVAPAFGGSKARSRTSAPTTLRLLSNGELMLQGSTSYRAYSADEMKAEQWNGEFALRLHVDGTLDTAYGVHGITQRAAHDNDFASVAYFPQGIGNDGAAYVGQSADTDDPDFNPPVQDYRESPNGKTETSLSDIESRLNHPSDQVPDQTGSGEQIQGVDGASFKFEFTLSDTVLEVIKSYSDNSPVGELAVKNLNHRRTESLVFSVSWRGSRSIDTSSLGAGDVVVDLPNGTSRSAHFAGYQPQADGSVRATYKLATGDGVWDSKDDGIYVVRSKARQVKDINGAINATQAMGVFDVQIG